MDAQFWEEQRPRFLSPEIIQPEALRSVPSSTHIHLKSGAIALEAIESAGLSYVPCTESQPLFSYKHLWRHRQQVTRASYGKKWNGWALKDMTGIQLMCGLPSYKPIPDSKYYYHYTSIDIEHRLIEKYPNIYKNIERIYRGACKTTPCIIKTKSEGIRFDAWTTYCGKRWAFKDDGGMLLELLADQCLTRLDHRYEQLEGSILEMPSFASKDPLRDIHAILQDISTETIQAKPRHVIGHSHIGDLSIEWGANNRSQLFPTEYCRMTSHQSNRNEVRFTRHAHGGVDGKCFNCGEIWWEVRPVSAGYKDAQRWLKGGSTDGE